MRLSAPRPVCPMTGFRRSLTAFAAALAMLWTPAAAQDGPVTGRVRDVRTGAPVEGALISIPGLRATARTDTSGTFVLQRVPAGTYAWTVTRLGYVPLNQEVELRPGDSFTVGMMPRPLALEGVTARVRRAERLLGRRRNAAPVGVLALGEEQLAGAAPMAESAVRLNIPIHPCSTSGRADQVDCVWRRGKSVSIRLFIDERPAFSLAQLGGYNSTDLYLVEFWGGTEIRVYTHRFAERLARGTERLMPRR